MNADIDPLEPSTRISYTRSSVDEHLLRQLLVLLEKISADAGFDQLSSAMQDVTEAARDQLATYLDDKAPYRSNELH